MKITPDTNVLLRIAVMDDEIQTAIALQALEDAEGVVVPLPTLCEFVWVLRQRYKRPAAEVDASLRELLTSSIVERTGRPRMPALRSYSPAATLLMASSPSRAHRRAARRS